MPSTTPPLPPSTTSPPRPTITADPEESLLTPLERQLLDEYAQVASNLDRLTSIVTELSATPSAEILDALRGLERKTSLVFTLLKASVYSIVLQQQIGEEMEGG